MLSIIRRIRTLAPTCLSVGLGAFFAIMIVPSSVTPCLSVVIAHSSNPCAIRQLHAAQGFVKIAVAIDQVASELLCEFVRKFGRAMVTAMTQKTYAFTWT